MSICLLRLPKQNLILTQQSPTRANFLLRHNMSTMQERKNALRKDIRQRLSALSPKEISSQSRAAQDIILSLPQYQQANRLSIYLSMPTAEAQTDLLVRSALQAGKEVFVPYIHRLPAPSGETKKRSVLEMLQLDSVDEYEGLGRDAWGIPSLPAEGLKTRANARGGYGVDVGEEEESDESLDLVVVPGVAFDDGMNRLGHGKGFYDDFLTRFYERRSRKKPFLGKRVSQSRFAVFVLQVLIAFSRPLLG